MEHRVKKDLCADANLQSFQQQDLNLWSLRLGELARLQSA